MPIDKLINIFFTIILVEMMVAIGMGVRFADVAAVARDWRLVARAALANYICVPVVAIVLLLLLRPHPMVAAGFLIAVVCPGAPYGPPFTAIAKGNVPLAVGLMVILAGSSALVAPLLLGVLLPWIAGGQALHVSVDKLLVTLIGAQFLPLCVGLAVRQWRPNWATILKRPAALMSMVLNLFGIGGLLFLQWPMLLQVRLIGFAAMLVLLIAALAAGWSLGGSGTDTRKALAIATSVRNVGVSLVIATGSFPGTPAVTAAMVFALFQTVVMTALAVGWGKLSPVSVDMARARSA